MWEAEALLCGDAVCHSVPTRLFYVLHVHIMLCKDLTEQLPLMLLLSAIKLATSFAFFFSLSAVNYSSSDHKRLLLNVLEKERFISCSFFSPFQQINTNTKIIAKALEVQ